MQLLRKKEIVILVFILIACLTYAHLRNVYFIGADDNWMLLNNYYVTHTSGYSLDYFVRIFKRIFDIQYSPLNTLYYSLVYKIHGFDAYYYHLFNFVVHLLSAGLVFLLSKRILSLFGYKKAGIISMLTALLWCVHPLNVEPVVWISGSKILWCTLFTLVAILLFMDGVLENALGKMALSVFAFAISFFFKEQALLTPIVLTLLLFVMYRVKGREITPGARKGVAVLALMYASLVPFAMITYAANNIDHSYIPMDHYSLWQRVVWCFYCLSFYINNLFLPFNLHYHYPYPFSSAQAFPVVYYIYPFIFLSFIVFLIRGAYRSNVFLFYLLCIGIACIEISIELQILPMTRPAIVADRYMYLPSFSLILLCLVLVFDAFRKISVTPRIKWVLRLFLFLYVLFLMSYSNQLVDNWKQLNVIGWSRN